MTAQMAESGVVLPRDHLLQCISKRTDFAMRRGPKYSLYAELRDQRLRRRKNAELLAAAALTTPPSKKTAASTLLRASLPVFATPTAGRKENRKPKGAPTTPPLAPPQAAQTRLGIIPTHKAQDERRFAGRSGVVAMRKSYSCLKEFSAVTSASNGARTASWLG